MSDTTSTDLQPTGTEEVVQVPDLESLETSTKVFLGAIRVWHSNIDSSNVSSKAVTITRQYVGDYVRAFNTGLDSAQHGYTFSVDGMALAEKLESAPSEEERDNYIKSMIQFASDGKERAEAALDGFRGVRRRIKQGIQELKSEDGDAAGIDSEIAILRQNDSVLRDFERILDWYISWWNEKTMESTYVETKMQNLNGSGKFARKGVVSKWNSLRESYLTYTTKMHRLQDDYYDVFKVGIEGQKMSAPQNHEAENVENTRIAAESETVKVGVAEDVADQVNNFPATAEVMESDPVVAQTAQGDSFIPLVTSSKEFTPTESLGPGKIQRKSRWCCFQ
ncbi:hypothetical protein GALMADRAFT_1298142 [Galerina marginata CBS 339.88]|uniref:Uncharacterized protein n=1 Tax=Galerina marginata (strain CBS 339.88) TaxID=685588 RepID=A0A067TDQ7_GALM3|nr:hypothetical protein GALMADRAFT_1298142 [Galerina marginata CBS 339.88]